MNELYQQLHQETEFSALHTSEEDPWMALVTEIYSDILPEYKAEQPYTGIFSGKRIKRGLYKSADGFLVNADVNGAANILRKSKQNFGFEELCRGLLASPQRIRLQ